jgi:hypothetical protein
MLILPCRSIGSRCCTQVTSNVRHQETQIQMRNVRFGKLPPKRCSAEMARAGGNSRLATGAFISGSGNSNYEIQPFACSAQEQPPERLGPSMVREAGQSQSHRARWVALFRHKPGCGSIQNMVAALVRLALMPNPSVNLTRNSPAWRAMLIMPCRASASRCRVQVTSNVRPAKNRLGLVAYQTRAPAPACVKTFGHRGGIVSVRLEVQRCRFR